MLVRLSSFQREATAALEVTFRESLYDRDLLIELHEALADRSTKRARRLRAQIRDQLAASASATRVQPLTWISKSRRWYRRGAVMMSIAGVTVVCLCGGALQSTGLQFWEPIWRRLQDFVGLVAGS